MSLQVGAIYKLSSSLLIKIVAVMSDGGYTINLYSKKYPDFFVANYVTYFTLEDVYPVTKWDVRFIEKLDELQKDNE